MRHTVIALFASVSIISPSVAQTRYAAIHPQPTLLSTEGVQEASQPADLGSTMSEANAKSRGRMDMFDRRIAASGNRALRSVCRNCATTAKWAPRRIVARAESREFPIADPAAAPDQ
ncbi:hypothetical protein MKK70_04820 [Methylobacterium sp. E-041]|uniref:hypothetical protein n=1 Tax=Methylobacterium sp. E-041 TaxID=2836573 RepID=UPI001FBB0204|nr:hypothetical protein [Methylobacterium sp. E-041]MCJ2104709.1 hypothetical protein [Methylobacterium sp. E-041]